MSRSHRCRARQLRSRLARVTFLFLAFFLLPSLASAQLPLARLDRLFPLGGKAGSEVVVTVQGKDLDELTTLHFDHPGFKAEAVKPGQFRVTIAPDTPSGTYEVRTVGKYGISGARLFAVSRDLLEVDEKEPNDTAVTAQKVPFNCVINGTSDGDGDDFFSFPLKKGQRAILDCQALRLDSTLRASLVLSSADGKELARSKPYHTRTDPLLDIIAPADGDYIVQLHDATYAGGLPYRLVISDHPHIENVFPQVVTPGETVNLTILGRNLPGGKPSGTGKVLDQELEVITLPWTAPKDPALLTTIQFHNHLPAASAVIRGMQFRPKGLENALNPVTVLFAQTAVTLEHEPNDSAEAAQSITLPTTISGRLDKPGDTDWYSFTAKAGEKIAVDLCCERLDLPGDLFVIITNSKGQEVAQFDDHGANFNALALYNRDPLGVFNVPANDTYRLLVQDRYGGGGPRYRYVLALSKPEPDFYPVVFHETNPDPTSPLVRQGGSASVEVYLNRANLSAPVVIEARGLPPGVSCPPFHIGPQSQSAHMVFTAAPDAKEWTGTIQLVATAEVEGKKITRAVVPVQRRWPIANISASRICRELCLAVRPEAPYGLTWANEKVSGTLDSTLEATLKVRRQGAFKGPIKLTGLQLHPGFSFDTAEIPADKDEFTVKLKVGKVPPGVFSLGLRGEAQVPFIKDVKTGTKSMVRVADPVPPLLVEVPAKK